MVQRHKRKKEESSITRLPDALNPSLLSVQVLLLPWFSSSFLLAFFFLVFRPETSARFPFFLPVRSRNCLIFARMISTCQISSNNWAPVHRMLHDFPHRWLLLHFGQIKSNYFYLMSFMKANRKQMDLTKCGVLVQQACKTWAQCYCVIQVSSQTCFGWLLSWREPAA